MQKMRYSEKELGLIKSLFAENEEALIALRKKLHGAKMTTVEKNLTKYSEDVQALIAKSVLPPVDTDAPIHQIIDLWLITDFKDKNPQEANIAFRAKKIQVDFLTNSIYGEKNISLDALIYNEDNDAETNLVNMTARNMIITYIEQRLAELKALAGLKDETPEETIDRLEKDSNK